VTRQGKDRLERWKDREMEIRKDWLAKQTERQGDRKTEIWKIWRSWKSYAFKKFYDTGSRGKYYKTLMVLICCS